LPHFPDEDMTVRHGCWPRGGCRIRYSAPCTVLVHEIGIVGQNSILLFKQVYAVSLHHIHTMVVLNVNGEDNSMRYPFSILWTNQNYFHPGVSITITIPFYADAFGSLMRLVRK